MNEPIGDLISKLQLSLYVSPDCREAVLSSVYGKMHFIEIYGDLDARYSLSQNLYNLFTEAANEENQGEDETEAFLERLIDFGYIPTSSKERGERVRGEYYKPARGEISGSLASFRWARKVAQELRAFMGNADFERVAYADYGDMQD